VDIIKFIHCDLTNKVRFLIVALIVRATFVTTFSPCFNVGSFIQVQNFGVTFWNKFEKGDWSFVLKFGTTTMIEQIDPFMFDFILLLFIPFIVSSNNKICRNLKQLSLWSLRYMASFQRVSFLLLLMVWGLMTHKHCIFF